MESFYAHIENNVVASVEVVTDEFFVANPARYSGKWLKVGEGSDLPFCGIGDIWDEENQTWISPEIEI